MKQTQLVFTLDQRLNFFGHLIELVEHVGEFAAPCGGDARAEIAHANLPQGRLRAAQGTVDEKIHQHDNAHGSQQNQDVIENNSLLVAAHLAGNLLGRRNFAYGGLGVLHIRPGDQITLPVLRDIG